MIQGCYLLLEQDGAETRVESTETLVLHDLGHATDETVGEGGLGHETDTGGLERAEGDVSEELGGSGRGKVDGGAVVGGCLIAELVDALLLEELVSTELEGTLEEVASKGRAETGQEGTGTLVGDHLPEATDEALVVGLGVELYPCLDAVGRLATHVVAARRQRASPTTAIDGHRGAQRRRRRTHRQE